MRRGIAWVAGIVGVVTALVLRFRRSRKTRAAAPDPAVELRRTLDEARSREEEAPVPEAQPGPEPPAEPVDRRREVHEQARAAIDEMRREPPAGEG